MKQLSVVLCLALLSCVSGDPTTTPVDAGHVQAERTPQLAQEEPVAVDKIVMMWGQSLAYGQGGYVSGLPAEWAHLAGPLPAVQYSVDVNWSVGAYPALTSLLNHGWEDLDVFSTGYGDFGPELGIGHRLAAVDNGFGIVKSVHGATNLYDNWDPTRSPEWLYQVSVDKTNERAAEQPGAVVVGLCLIQGTSDGLSTEANSLAYEANLTALIAAVRLEFGNPTLAIVINALHIDNTATYAANVRAGQIAVAAADDRVAIIYTDDIPLADAYHHGPEGYAVMGDRMGEALIGLIGDPMSQDSDYLENALYNAIYRGVDFTAPPTVYLAMHAESAGEDATGAELSGFGYIRQATTWTDPVNGSGSNSSEPEFSAVGGDFDPAYGVATWDAETGGNMLNYTALVDANGDPDPVTVLDGLTFRFAAGQIVVTRK